MLTLTKKQVKGMLDTLKFSLNSRPALSTLRVRNGYLYLTDGYILVRMRVDDPQSHTDLEIPYDKLERWYKLAKTSDKIGDEDLWGGELCNTESQYTYPEVERLMSFEGGGENRELVFDTAKLARISTILGTDQVIITRYNDRYEVKPCDPSINGTAILMGINN